MDIAEYPRVIAGEENKSNMYVINFQHHQSIM